MPDVRLKHPLLAGLISVVVAVCLHGSAHAQISPGPLARVHQSLNGSSNCTTCHALGRERTFKCLECHSEIASRVAAHKGLHAAFNIPPGSSQTCASCHSDHNGEDFPLIKWDTKNLNHAQTGFLLEGKHAALDCKQCHSAEKIPASQRSAMRVNLNHTFLGLSQSCASCHQDAHQGRLGNNCAQCHDSTDWKTVNPTKFDHAKTKFPLTGLHMQVACEKCHTPGPDSKPRYTGLAFGQCADCHRDPHRGAFPQGCQACHNTGGWKKVSAQGLSARFDHSRTKFPLLGKHVTVGCMQCHAGGDFKKPIFFEKCADCHKPDPHKGQFAKRPDGGECASCHTVDGWKPSKFTLADHAASAYPLAGAHAKVACAACHIPRGADTVFKLKFQHCTDCHDDKHAGQFAAAPYFNACERCHTLDGYRPSTFSLARHKQTRFALTGEHVAVPCADCHKESAELKPKPAAVYHWSSLSCTSCHADPHRGQFDDRMRQAGTGGKTAGCEACHSTKSWKELTKFDHSKTAFPLLGSHRAAACIDCHKPPNMERTLAHANFKAAPKQCEQCHEDIHGGQFAKANATPCAECHNPAKWRPSLFDHDRHTSFPLAGAHRYVGCAECHKLMREIDGKPVLFYKPTPTECAACHGATKG